MTALGVQSGPCAGRRIPEDWYGQQLEFKKRLEESAKEFVDYSDCMKPL